MTIDVETVVLFGAIGGLITALVGWYTARNAYRGQTDEHELAKETQRVDEAKALVELSSSLVHSVNDELERVRNELHKERELRDLEQKSVRRLRQELKNAEKQVSQLLEQLQLAEERTERMRSEMTALTAELHEFRNGDRASGARTRWDDSENETGSH